MPARRHWGELTTREIAAMDGARAIAILPIAAMEQHGPHLPLGTDRFIAEGFVSRVVDLLGDDAPALFLPVAWLGASREHGGFAGTLSAGWEGFVRHLLDIGEGVRAAGLKKLVIVTSHGGNVAAMDMAALELRARHSMIVVATSWYRMGIPAGLFAEDELAHGIHGGDLETSLMMHLRPDLVRREELADFASRQRDFESLYRRLRIHGRIQFGWRAEDLNPVGVVGNAAAATAEKGRSVIEHGARAFVELLEDLDRLDPERP